MNQTDSAYLKEYFRQIRLLLPIYSKEEKKFLKDFRRSVEDYIENHPDCTYTDIIDRFEEPADVVHNYISSLDQEQLYKRISLTKTIRTAIIVVVVTIVIAVIALFLYRVALAYNVYLEAKDQIITHEYTVIE